MVALFYRNLSGPPLPGHQTLAFACFPNRRDAPKGSMVTLFHSNVSGPRKRCVLRCPKGFHGGSFPQKPFWALVAGPSDTGVCVLSEKGGCPKGFHGDPFAQKLIWVAKTLCIAMSQKWLFSTGTFLGPRCRAV